MSKVITINVRVRTTGDGLDHSDNFAFVNNNGPLPVYQLCTAGNNNVSGTANGIVMIPPSSTSGSPSMSAVPKTLKGAPGDVGIPLDPATPQVLPAGAFVLAYGAAEGLWEINF